MCQQLKKRLRMIWNKYFALIFYFQFLLLLSLMPYVAGTFFPFTSYRPPIYPSSRYRSPRSSQNNLVSLQSSVLGVRVLVPRALFDLFNVQRPPYQPPYNPRPYNPYSPPIDLHAEIPRGAIAPNGYSPGRSFPPPISPNTFFNLMRAFYPNLIYRPDPRYPNVFAIRFPAEPHLPTTHLPDLPDVQSLAPDLYRDPLPLAPQPPAPPLNPEFNEELPPNGNEFFEPPLPARDFSPPPPPSPPSLPLQQQSQPFARSSTLSQPSLQTQNQQFGRTSLPFGNSAQRRSPQNHLIIIRSP